MFYTPSFLNMNPNVNPPLGVVHMGSHSRVTRGSSLQSQLFKAWKLGHKVEIP